MNLSAWRVASFTLCVLSVPLAAQDPEPGSVLVYPSLRETNGRATVVSVTNIHPTTSIIARYRYVNIVPTPGNPFAPSNCLEVTRFELLTPGDTFTIPVLCHNPTTPKRNGYLVIDAILPGTIASVSHNYMIGSEWVALGTSAAWSLGAISFQSPLADGVLTDLDGDGELDFDGLEYTMCPDTLHIDTFLASAGNNLALINLTGGTMHTATVGFTVFNDNESVFSTQLNFRCWFDQPLDMLSPIFTAVFLSSTAQDPSETDADCDGIGDLESGWAIIDGIVATSAAPQTIPNPALLGAVTGSLGFERGRPLWRTGNNPNGDFLNHLLKHPEFP